MATAPAALDAYREEADRFIAALDEEYYLHFAGLKENFELTPIYERYADLATLDACRSLGEATELGDRGAIELWRFACEGYMGDLTRSQAEELAHLEASLTVEVDGEEIGFRLLRPALANEPDRDRRERLDRARVELSETQLNPHYVTIAETRREATMRLGAANYRELYARFGFPLEELGAQCERFLAETEELFVSALDRLFRRRVGVSLEEARRWDVPRLFRAPEWDSGFPASKMVPALESTLDGLGIDLRAQENVHLDLEPRPTKTPRAFCAPIEVPGRVMLVIQPMGGPDDWHALFHEAGHTEHYAHVFEDLPVEAKRLGDVSVTEAWATMMEHLLLEPGWLSRRLDFPKPEEFAAEAATGSLYLLRRYCGKLLYELEFHGVTELDPKAMSARYIELLGDALKIEPSRTDFLGDIDPSFYVTGYLRSWALQSQLREHFRERFGSEWFADRKAGGMLRELWSDGHRLNADELLADVTGQELEMEAFAQTLREQLR